MGWEWQTKRPSRKAVFFQGEVKCSEKKRVPMKLQPLAKDIAKSSANNTNHTIAYLKQMLSLLRSSRDHPDNALKNRNLK